MAGRTTPPEPWLRAVGLTKTFNGVVAIGDADLELRVGEVRGVVGPNGAGKSTLMQMLAGIHRIDEGQLLIDGTPVRFRGPQEALAAGIALVPQEMQLAINLSVAGNIVLGREPRRGGVVSAGRSRRLAADALRRVGSSIDPDADVSSLSTVERRLVMVARALVADARLIILDEPTAALAPSEATAVLRMVSTVAEGGVSVLYVSHRFDDISAVAESVTGVRDARVVADLGREEITHRRLVELVTPVDAVSHRVPETARGARVDGEQVLVVDALGAGPLRNASFTVRAGEILGVAGLAGSGADELIRAVGAIEPRRTGTVTVGGAVLKSGDRLRAVQAGVAYVPGDRTLATLPSHDIASNISISDLRAVATLGVVSPRRERRLAAETAARVDLAGSLGRALSSLSGGNQQKAVFARWIATHARVLLLHDPTAGVDVGARAEIHQRVRELAADGDAVLLVTTDLPELVELCDRILVVDRGEVVDEIDGADASESGVLAAMTRGGRPLSAAS
ncbi:sugar ABC transporter ATP-binding protein [Pseudolysinimonas sp.]|uniref:sugar ABC transporter ATP-binding protein n=1 Tax=Pseudolysinimonas sp. TaxID=2680009 RepID=UPI003F7E5498